MRKIVSLYILSLLNLRLYVDRTEGRATEQNSQMEEMGHRINQECRLLHLPPNRLENPQEWKASV